MKVTIPPSQCLKLINEMEWKDNQTDMELLQDLAYAVENDEEMIIEQ